MDLAHQHPHRYGAPRNRLAAVLAITLAVLVAEVVGSVVTGSLALLADAGHLLADAAGIGLSLVAATLARRPATPARTFGHYRLEILAAAANAVLLVGVAGYVLVEAIRRLTGPPHIAPLSLAIFGAAGIVGSAVSASLLVSAQRTNLNARGAFLEVLADGLGSVGVVLAAVVIAATGWLQADAVVSVLIGLFILPRTWRLFREATDVLLEGTPPGLDLTTVRQHIMQTPGVLDVHDLHAWLITSGMPVLSAHVVVADETLAHGDQGQLLDALGGCLAGHFDIEHCTFQLEPASHQDHEPTGHE